MLACGNTSEKAGGAWVEAGARAAAPELPWDAMMNHAVAKCKQGWVWGCDGSRAAEQRGEQWGGHTGEQSGARVGGRVGGRRSGRVGGRAGVLAAALLLAAAGAGGCAQPQGPSVRIENAPGSAAVGRFSRGSEVVFSGDAVRELVGDDVFAASGDGARRDAALGVIRNTGLPDDSWVTELRPALERPVYVYLGRYQENSFVYYRRERRSDRGR